jgi:hypothetical protein
MSSTAEERRATGTWSLETQDGFRSGTGALEVTDEGVAAGWTSVDFLDVDSLSDADLTVTLGLFPWGSLRLSQLARRHETFVRALREGRDRARTAGMLAHGIDTPVRFDGLVRLPNEERDAAFLVYATHLTVVPWDGEVFQIPFGAMQAVRFIPESWVVEVEAPGGPFGFGQLARHTDPFFRALSTARDAQAIRLAEISGSGLFADGAGVPASKLDSFDRLLESWSAPERLEGARALIARGDRPSAQIGLVELLDPDEEGLAAKVPLPGNVAAFLLVQFAGRNALEVLCGPAAATYLFQGGIEAIGRDLQAIHFRRRPLALSAAEEKGSAGRPYRLAFRRLEPLRRLRTATEARVVHSEGWKDAVDRAVGPGARGGPGR